MANKKLTGGKIEPSGRGGTPMDSGELLAYNMYKKGVAINEIAEKFAINNAKAIAILAPFIARATGFLDGIPEVEAKLRKKHAARAAAREKVLEQESYNKGGMVDYRKKGLFK